MILERGIRITHANETDGTTTTMAGEEEEEEVVIAEITITTDTMKTSTQRIVNESANPESVSCWYELASNRRRRWTTLWIN